MKAIGNEKFRGGEGKTWRGAKVIGDEGVGDRTAAAERNAEARRFCLAITRCTMTLLGYVLYEQLPAPGRPKKHPHPHPTHTGNQTTRAHARAQRTRWDAVADAV